MMRAGAGRFLRAILKALWFVALYRSGAVRWAQWRLQRSGAILVLNFHRVLNDGEFESTNSPAGMVMRTRTFAQLLSRLAGRFPVVNLANKCGPTAGILSLAITFDDGWEDNHRNAAPVLERSSLPACIFLCPASMDRASPYWPEAAAGIWKTAAGQPDGIERLRGLLWQHGIGQDSETFDRMLDALKRLDSPARARALAELAACFPPGEQAVDRTMGWETVRSMRQRGFCFGSHTMHHEILTTLDETEMDSELVGARQRLAQETGNDLALFSYPNGDWNRLARERVAAAGYELAFANDPGVWCSGTDRLTIPRINLNEGKVTGPDRCFSEAAALYYIVWQPYRLWRLQSRKCGPTRTPVPLSGPREGALQGGHAGPPAAGI